MAENPGSLSGLTEGEAQEFHKIFVQSFILFTVVAIIAHVLAYMWRPWFPGVDGYSAITTDGAASVQVAMTNAQSLTSFIL
ncbi:MAG: light-harvesting antenna LH1, beta subunit [Rhodospirillaceae bacterium]|nr:light-harvesting antenna LH1, beta subunit [Rhodospirillaceae bacterium]MCY4238665.1 light-harvesting antenna LH1, beta subunit [Rhodospirillaceae bacterium]MCY4310927.1 light-harvesting antenna LH1, beta subunit [Rhodospirillaceae bacterium]